MKTRIITATKVKVTKNIIKEEKRKGRRKVKD